MSEKTGWKTGDLVPQPHGGAILNGAAHPDRHVPGPGRPPSQVKEALRKSFDDRLPLLERIADGEVVVRIREVCPECGHEPEPMSDDEMRKLIPRISDRLKALEIMAKHGLEESRVDESLVRELAEVVEREVGDAVALERIQQGWVEVLAARFA